MGIEPHSNALPPVLGRYVFGGDFLSELCFMHHFTYLDFFISRINRAWLKGHDHCRPYTECFFSSSLLFFGRNIQKVLFSAFWGQNVLFLLSVLFFQENTIILEVLGTIKLHLFQSLLFCTNFSRKKIFCLALLRIKFTPVCTTVHMYFWICTTDNMYLWKW